MVAFITYFIAIIFGNVYDIEGERGGGTGRRGERVVHSGIHRIPRSLRLAIEPMNRNPIKTYRKEREN